MTDKWTIRKYPLRTNGRPSIFSWLAFPPGVTPSESVVDATKECEYYASSFDHVLELVSHEIRKTRTVEVELPMTTPKLRYTKPPSMTYHVDVWCDGPKCDMQRLEHDGDGWTCDICGTFWDDPEGAGMDASESWGDELDDLPLYNEEGVKQ